jgi:hypothetical protein
MTLERPSEKSALRLVGGVDFTPKAVEPSLPKRRRTVAIDLEPEETPAAKMHWRTRELVREDIKLHMEARAAYGQAVAWESAAESEKLPQDQIEEARQRTAMAFNYMGHRGRHLVVCMPTDPRALVDLLMYLEQNFSVLPQEISGRSLAFHLLRTMRLSLRKAEKYGKYRGSVTDPE